MNYAIVFTCSYCWIWRYLDSAAKNSKTRCDFLEILGSKCWRFSKKPTWSLTASFPLKSYRNPIGKDRLPTTIFEGRAVKLRGCIRLFLVCSGISVLFPAITYFIYRIIATPSCKFSMADQFWFLGCISKNLHVCFLLCEGDTVAMILVARRAQEMPTKKTFIYWYRILQQNGGNLLMFSIGVVKPKARMVQLTCKGVTHRAKFWATWRHFGGWFFGLGCWRQFWG